MTTTTNLAAIQKVFYVEDTLHKQFNQKSVLYDKCWKKWELDASGKSYTFGAITRGLPNAGSGMSEGGDFAAASFVGNTTIVVPDTQLNTPVELSGRVIRAAKGAGKGAFVSAVRLTVQQAMLSTMHSINRQLNGDGTDALAYWTGADDTSGTVVDDNYGNAFAHLPYSGTITVDVVDTTDDSTLLGTAIVVTRGADNAADVSITWTGTVSGSADGDYAVLTGTLGKQLTGIQAIISASDPILLSGGLHGLTVASNPFWRGNVFANSGTNRDLTLELMQKPLTRVGVISDYSQEDVEFLLCNEGIFNKYISLCVEQKRQVNRMALDGGQDSVSFNNKPLILDPQHYQNRISYIVPDAISVLTSSGGVVWAEFEDASQWKMKPGSVAGRYADSYQSQLVFYGGVACKARNAHSSLQDISI